MEKIIYRCPNENRCPLKKHCRAITLATELKEPISVWIKCDAEKKSSGGKNTELLVLITEKEKAA